MQDLFGMLFGIQYCYWVKMMNAHLDFTGDMLP
jgi:hypothetical protein